MFTGLVEGQATVAAIEPDGPGVRLLVQPPSEIEQLGPTDIVKIGDSIATNGCCLTVVAVGNGVASDSSAATNSGAWAFEAGEETLSRTNIGRLQVGDRVNFERSLPASSRLGGHFVQGHVDCLGEVDEILPDGEWTKIFFRIPLQYGRQLVEKGSITIDGISLTVVDVEDAASTTRFSVALIPHTLDVTTLGSRAVGDVVNIETDILGKYAERFLRGQKNPHGNETRGG